ncbi:MAG: phosphoribosyl-ATP diphosphatase [Gammaproteobacteria bacterium]|nr:phosphoribosyl-ATP diphosphatase [Gammaproteobacteria bacterium]
MKATGIEFLTVLEDVIQQRRNCAVTGSYTAELMASGERRIAQKVGEEAVELVLAATGGDRVETINEAADLLYHVLVLLNNQDIRLADVVAALESRHTA